MQLTNVRKIKYERIKEKVESIQRIKDKIEDAENDLKKWKEEAREKYGVEIK